MSGVHTKDSISKKKVRCQHWEEVSTKWIDTNCNDKGSEFYTYNSKNELTSITCECNHLSEFSISLTDRDDDDSKTSTVLILVLLVVTLTIVVILIYVHFFLNKKPDTQPGDLYVVKDNQDIKPPEQKPPRVFVKTGQ